MTALSPTFIAAKVFPPAHLDGLVKQINALAPDIVLFGGDYVRPQTAKTLKHVF